MTVQFTASWWMLVPLFYTLLVAAALIWHAPLQVKTPRSSIFARLVFILVLLFLVRFLP